MNIALLFLTSTLVLDGTPPVPPELEERISPYLDSRAADLLDLAADGSSMLIATRFAETAQVHQVRTPLGMRKQLTFRDDPISSARMVPGTKDALVFQTDRGGNENYQLYRLEPSSAKATLLTDGKSRNLGYMFTHKGDRLFFTSNARNGRDMDIWLSDGTGAKKPELFLERTGHWELVDISRDDKMLLIVEYISIEDTRLHTVDLSTKAVVRISPEQPRASYRQSRFAASGKAIFSASDREGEFVELYQTDLAGKSWKPLSRHIPWSVEQVSLSPDGRTLAFSTNEGGVSVLHLLDTASGKERVEKSIPRGVITDVLFAKKANVIGLSITSAVAAMDVYLFEPGKKKLTRWTESEIGSIDSSTFVEPSLIEYPSFDGKNIPAFYFEPKGPGPHPVLIDIHGGPEAQARPYFSAFRQYYVTQLGIAVLVPNVRGSDGYGKTYVSLDNGLKRMDSVKDIGALLDWIGKNPKLDAKRVAVTGGSYGGFMVLASLVEYGERIRAGIEVVGVSNFVTFLQNTSEYRRDLRRAEYGDERDPKIREFLTKTAPITNASKIRSRLFVAQGANDPRVPASEAEQIVKAVRGQKQEVWYMLANNEGHGFAHKQNRDTYAILSAMFLEKHLKR